MIVNKITEQYLMYENMEIWEVKSLDEFFKAHESLKEIFEKEYGFKYEERNDSLRNFQDSDIMVITKLLDHFGDKFFVIFSNNDKAHSDLKYLQDKKIINFGMDIHVINPNRIYILEMDKTQDLKAYDTV